MRWGSPRSGCSTKPAPTRRLPSRVVRRDEAVAAVVPCLEKLSDAHRDVLDLRFLHGLSVAEVASRLGKSAASIVAAARRALAALRAAMNERAEFIRSM